jgi:hypothetical protein
MKAYNVISYFHLLLMLLQAISMAAIDLGQG